MPKWRAIRDDQGRIVIAIAHNSDVGDAWEWADSPNYPEPAMELAYQHRHQLHHLRNDSLAARLGI